jgi:hypothetical protein
VVVACGGTVAPHAYPMVGPFAVTPAHGSFHPHTTPRGPRPRAPPPLSPWTPPLSPLPGCGSWVRSPVGVSPDGSLKSRVQGAQTRPRFFFRGAPGGGGATWGGGMGCGSSQHALDAYAEENLNLHLDLMYELYGKPTEQVGGSAGAGRASGEKSGGIAPIMPPCFFFLASVGRWPGCVLLGLPRPRAPPPPGPVGALPCCGLWGAVFVGPWAP